MGKSTPQRLEYEKKYRAQRTPEQKAKANERARIYRKNRSEETRAKERETLRLYYKTHPEKFIFRNTREYRLKLKYGLTVEQYQKMLLEQDNQCKICSGDLIVQGDDKACVDHNHTTNKVRGLLCKTCNFMLGYAQENRDTLLEAVKYLDYYNVYFTTGRSTRYGDHHVCDRI